MSLLLVQNMMGDLLMPNLYRQISCFFNKWYSSNCSKLAGENFELDFWTTHKQLYKIYHCDQFLQNGLEVYPKERLFYLQGIS